MNRDIDEEDDGGGDDAEEDEEGEDACEVSNRSWSAGACEVLKGVRRGRGTETGGRGETARRVRWRV